MVLDLPGVVVGGYASADEARESLRIAIEMHLDGMREDGVPIGTKVASKFLTSRNSASFKSTGDDL